MSQALLTDLYELTMAFGYWKQGMHERESVFLQFFRRAPFRGGYAVTAGLEGVVEYLNGFRFDDSDVAYLKTLENVDGSALFEKDFLDYLLGMRFVCDVDAITEGRVVFPHEPLLRIQGPLLQCQILESVLLNLLNFPTLIATKAARVCQAAQGDQILEFGLRRAQGVDGAMTASRAAYVGGCHATSNVLAGKRYGIPVRGTHAHSWIMAFDHELEAFEAYAEAMPANCIFLVDTYDTIHGVKHAIEVGKRLRERGQEMLGVRLDSGDLTALSIEARKLLDDAGFPNAVIVASNELDEYVIAEAKKNGAQIAVWGVGTHLVTGGQHPALDGVYKLSAIRDEEGSWKYRLKLSEKQSKVSPPGILQIRRYKKEGQCVADLLYDEASAVPDTPVLVDASRPENTLEFDASFEYEDLLVPVFRAGKQVYELPSLEDIRDRAHSELSTFSLEHKALEEPAPYTVGMEQSLFDLRNELIQKAEQE